MKYIDREFFNRNEKLFIIAFIIVFGSLIVTTLIGYLQAGDEYGRMSAVFNYMHSHNIPMNATDVSGDSALGYFIHNFIIDLISILGGFLFSVFSVINVIHSSMIAGSYLGKDLMFGLVSTIPHGIIEYLASVFALTIAFIITRAEVRIIKTRSFDGLKTDFKDILILFILDIIFLAIAAFIEADITSLFVKFVYGL